MQYRFDSLPFSVFLPKFSGACLLLISMQLFKEPVHDISIGRPKEFVTVHESARRSGSHGVTVRLKLYPSNTRIKVFPWKYFRVKLQYLIK